MIKKVQRIRSLIFNIETDEVLLNEDDELAEFLQSEMKRRGCRVMTPDELGWNEKNTNELS